MPRHRVVALVSGGKDSCYSMMKCVAHGHEIVALANLHPPAAVGEELDSFMYQTVGHSHIEAIAQAMELPLFRREISGTAVNEELPMPENSTTLEQILVRKKRGKEHSKRRRDSNLARAPRSLCGAATRRALWTRRMQAVRTRPRRARAARSCSASM